MSGHSRHTANAFTHCSFIFNGIRDCFALAGTQGDSKLDIADQRKDRRALATIHNVDILVSWNFKHPDNYRDKHLPN